MSTTPAEEISQTPGKTEETTESQQEETYTKAQVTEQIKHEVAKVVAKHSQKMSTLQAELEAERRKSLPDPEKVAAEMADKDKAIAERDTELSGLKLENVKIRALVKAGADPEKLDSLMKRVVGTTPEEIETDIQELKTLGFLGQSSKSLGTSTTIGARQQSSVSLVDQIFKLETEMLKLETPPLEKEKMAKEVIRLKGKLAKGDT